MSSDKVTRTEGWGLRTESQTSLSPQSSAPSPPSHSITLSPCHRVTLSLLLLAGCGYTQSGNPSSTQPTGYQWRSLYREDIQTVAIPIFTNKSFARGVEFELSKAVINQLEAHAPYKVVSRERADTILEGEIVAVRTHTISTDRNTGIPQEQLLSLRVNFLWKDLRSGKILVQRKNFEQTAPYYPTLGEGQFHGSQDAVEKLALAIVQELQADW